MANPTPSRTSIGGGFLIALCLTIGVAIGVSKGQPTIGLLIGVGVGAVLAIGVWLVNRR